MHKQIHPHIYLHNHKFLIHLHVHKWRQATNGAMFTINISTNTTNTTIIVY